MNIVSIIQKDVVAGLNALYGIELAPEQVPVNVTRKEFTGDYTVVVFPFTKPARQKPDQIGHDLGEWLCRESEHIAAFNVIKGFLNLSLEDAFWIRFLDDIREKADYGMHPARDEKVLVEFSSPNTNKPLHLGHIRNILLGWSVSRILEAAGYEVYRVQVVNDRGIAICKSMLAWERFGEGATPASAGMKGDHFVGHYYVRFEQEFRKEYQAWQESPAGKALLAEKAGKEQDAAAFFKAYKNEYFNTASELGRAAKAMLLKWESGDPATVALWEKMNGWVYEGFNATYEKLRVHFDKLYFESDTYLLGKDTIARGLKDGVFYKKEDGSVWIDLTDAKLDHKIVLRSDGTSVYITQDIGTAQLRYQDFGAEKMVYVVADEQNYHFQVLFETLKRLREPYADGLFHLSYGMVDLPTGKMKSREGTVVDADDLIAEVIAEAAANSAERGTLTDSSEEERQNIISQIGLAALKFFIIKVHPKKRMVFDPKESVDLQGQTGPYVQNAYVRIQSVLRKADGQLPATALGAYAHPDAEEKSLIAMIYQFPELIRQAAEEFDPSHLAGYCYDLAKAYHRFYHDHPILKAESEAARDFRLVLSQVVGRTLQQGMDLLGIEMPPRM